MVIAGARLARNARPRLSLRKSRALRPLAMPIVDHWRKNWEEDPSEIESENLRGYAIYSGIKPTKGELNKLLKRTGISPYVKWKKQR